MKREDKENTYIVVRDERGMDFLCPVEPDKKANGEVLDENVCFERDVTERYAGRITIQET